MDGVSEKEAGGAQTEAVLECEADDLIAEASCTGVGFGLGGVAWEARGLGLGAESEAICLRGGTTGATMLASLAAAGEEESKRIGPNNSKRQASD